MTPLNCLSLHAATLGIEASTDESGVGSIRHAAPVTGLYTRTFFCLKHSLFHKLLCIFWASEPTSLPPRSLPELPCLLHTSPHPSTPAPASRGCVSDGSCCGCWLLPLLRLYLQHPVLCLAHRRCLINGCRTHPDKKGCELLMRSGSTHRPPRHLAVIE